MAKNHARIKEDNTVHYNLNKNLISTKEVIYAVRDGLKINE